ncbi:hypothetical protein Tsubulata_013369 [Turnera subulata]|uniref:ATPase AAA-type core domain-containing protein n=1 Tax=Turnera subulata TaxID=218843 RepID=A0A9Q0G383_9ROSI|nr:hypothetical protein Tsubulata_013369 [Turnera subulata]
MASLGRVVVRAAAARSPLPKALNPPLFHRSFGSRIHSAAAGSQICRPLSAPNADESTYSVFPAVVAGLLGVGMVQVAYADADEAAIKPPTPPSEAPPSTFPNLEEIAKKERQRIEELLKSKGLRYGSYPRFTVAVKGQKVTIKFPIPPTSDIPQLIANLVSNLGVKVEDPGGGSAMSLRAWDSAVAWQLTLSYPDNQRKSDGDKVHSGDTNAPDQDLYIHLFRSLISADKAEIEFIKHGSLSTRELDAFVSTLQLAGGTVKTLKRKPGEGNAQMPSADKSVSSLESMGVRIYGLNPPQENSSNSEISWDNIAGYDHQKREIEDTILLALQSPEIYDDIARGTRRKFESNRPRAGVPLLYVPLEIVMSKYYGESERLLGKVFSLANELPNGAIIFLDEVDSFAAARDSEMHEATRRILSVLLRQIDGFEQDKKVVVIAATNRKQDLDPALISRFDSMITFGLPDRQNRQEIAAQYAKHLTKSDLEEFARVTEESEDSRSYYAETGIRHVVIEVAIKFQIPPTSDIPNLIAKLVSNLGVKVENSGGAADMSLRARNSGGAWQLTLSYPDNQRKSDGDKVHSGDTNAPDQDLYIHLFRSLSADKAEIEFIKHGSLSTRELDALVSTLQLAEGTVKTLKRKPGRGNARMPSADKSVSSLESMGVRIYGLNQPQENSSNSEISWDNIAGYDHQKREIEDTILLALQSPEIYDDIARGTRRKFESNRPRAGVPLLYVPLEIVMSKYYGESERLLGKVFSLANELPNGAIIFLDEVDSFAAARDSEMHEGTRRILSVLLQQIDGFEQDKKVVVIAATNRKQDLDPALISRFDSIITFGLPDRQNRQEIAAQFAKHLTKSDLEELARVIEELFVDKQIEMGNFFLLCGNTLRVP